MLAKEGIKKFLRVEEVYTEEVDDLEFVLGTVDLDLAAVEEGEEEEAEEGGAFSRVWSLLGGGTKKRKRGAGESSGRATKHDMSALFVEGYKWYCGLNYRKMDVLRGQMLIEAAADEGVAIAEAWCIWRVWGGREEDYEEGFKRFKELAEGDGEHQAIAMCNLGFCYDDGYCVAKDEAKAFEWYEKAAEKGDSSAMRSLGYCYRYGHGVAEDIAKAREWFTKAAALGNAIAATWLAILSA